MALYSRPPAGGIVQDYMLEDWKVIGSGGFGQIFRARHRPWCCDVAVKLLHYDNGSSTALLREVKMMRQARSPFVTELLGVFQGQVPSSHSIQLGLVMEFMERGSLAALQEALQAPPPPPLVFRLAHQVALGLNFLHSLTPPVLHLDLKPSNILLDSSLRAKLTDFGLAKFSISASRSSKKDGESGGGTYSYMPPEAFNISYTPTRHFDIYSFGILLWSIVTGKQPYADALSSVVRFRIPLGDRPSLEDVPCDGPGPAGLTELMKKCWTDQPSLRPRPSEITSVTEKLLRSNAEGINDAVHLVLTALDRKAEEEGVADQLVKLRLTRPPDEMTNICSDVLTGPSPIQEVASARAVTQTRSPQQERSRAVQSKKSSVKRIPPPPSDRTSQQSSAVKKTHKDQLSNQWQRQYSNPGPFPAEFPQINIKFSNVSGIQIGNNNSMTIESASRLERRRHPTAPSTFNLTPPS